MTLRPTVLSPTQKWSGPRDDGPTDIGTSTAAALAAAARVIAAIDIVVVVGGGWYT
jgi:hypothetical protein